MGSKVTWIAAALVIVVAVTVGVLARDADNDQGKVSRFQTPRQDNERQSEIAASALQSFGGQRCTSRVPMATERDVPATEVIRRATIRRAVGLAACTQIDDLSNVKINAYRFKDNANALAYLQLVDQQTRATYRPCFRGPGGSLYRQQTSSSASDQSPGSGFVQCGYEPDGTVVVAWMPPGETTVFRISSTTTNASGKGAVLLSNVVAWWHATVRLPDEKIYRRDSNRLRPLLRQAISNVDDCTVTDRGLTHPATIGSLTCKNPRTLYLDKRVLGRTLVVSRTVDGTDAERIVRVGVGGVEGDDNDAYACVDPAGDRATGTALIYDTEKIARGIWGCSVEQNADHTLWWANRAERVVGTITVPYTTDGASRERLKFAGDRLVLNVAER
jgi:hypothetical protein